MIIIEWTDERMDSWIDGRMSAWTNEWMNELMGGDEWKAESLEVLKERTNERMNERGNDADVESQTYLWCHILKLAAYLPTLTRSTELHRDLLLYCSNFLSISVTFRALMSTLRVIALYTVVRYNGGNYPIIPFTNMTNDVISYCPIYWIKVSEQNLWGFAKLRAMYFFEGVSRHFSPV